MGPFRVNFISMNCFPGKEMTILPDKGQSVILTIFLICLAFPLLAQSGSFQIGIPESAFSSNPSLKNTDHLQSTFRSPWTGANNSLHYVRDEYYDQLYNRSMGWFCKTEWKLEQKTGIPLRFRIGSYSATARLEGK